MSVVIQSVHKDMTPEAYHNASGISSTALRTAAQAEIGMQRYHEIWVKGNKPDFSDKEWAKFGTVVHLLTLEPDKVGERLTTKGGNVRPSLDRAYAPFFGERLPKNRLEVSAEMLTAAKTAVDFIAPMRDAADFVAYEMSIFWQESLGDGLVVDCKGRLDNVCSFMVDETHCKAMINDLKTMSNLGKWGMECKAMKYRLQAAHYVTAFSAAWLQQDPIDMTDEQLDDCFQFNFVVVGKDAIESNAGYLRQVKTVAEHDWERKYKIDLRSNLELRKEVLREIAERTRDNDWNRQQVLGA